MHAEVITLENGSAFLEKRLHQSLYIMKQGRLVSDIRFHIFVIRLVKPAVHGDLVFDNKKRVCVVRLFVPLYIKGLRAPGEVHRKPCEDRIRDRFDRSGNIVDDLYPISFGQEGEKTEESDQEGDNSQGEATQ